MNFLNVFEERISGVFGSASSAAAPFSFKKLAKKAASEMEKETYVINGVDTAPALFTVLVAQDDDAAMRPLYLNLTEETSLFLEAHAQRRGYTFVGKPLVRFMVDPSLKHGKFSVFAENVDARTLDRLREEELRYASTASGAAQPPVQPSVQPAPQPIDLGLGPIGSPDASDSAGLTSMPADMALDVIQDACAMEQQAVAPQPVMPSQPAVQHNAHVPAPAPMPAGNVPLVNPRPDYYQQVQHLSREEALAQDDRQLAMTPQPAPQPVQQPQTQLRNVPLVGSRQQAPQPQATALLIDRQTGRTYPCAGERTVIGRERTTGGIVLHDPNVSRRHAQLTRHHGYWTITDLNSTNGTLVNDVDVDECALRDGDLVTLGLTNLEFREG